MAQEYVAQIVLMIPFIESGSPHCILTLTLRVRLSPCNPDNSACWLDPTGTLNFKVLVPGATFSGGLGAAFSKESRLRFTRGFSWSNHVA